MQELNYGLFKTKFGWCGFLCAPKNEIVTFSFALPSKTEAFQKVAIFAGDNDFEIADSVPIEHPFITKTKRYASGERESFAGIRVSLEHLTDFQQRVMKIVRRIGYGKTMSYGQVAEKASAPRAARAVGTVMRKNRTPLIIPCHRVVSSCGIGGYSAADGVSMKQRLLNLELNE